MSFLVIAVWIICLKVKPGGTFWVREVDKRRSGARAIKSSRLKTGDTWRQCHYGDTESGPGLNEMLKKDYIKEMVTSKTHDKSNTAMLRINDTPNGDHPTTCAIQNVRTS